MIRFIAGLAVGAVAGAAASYIICKKKFNKRLDDIEATNKAINERKASKVTGPIPEPTDELREELRKPIDESEFADNGHDISEDPDYAEGIDPPDDERINDGYKDGVFQYTPSKRPYMITAAQFESDKTWDKRTIMWYAPEERAMCTETGTELEPDELGFDIGLLDDDNFDEADDGYLYIRNPSLGIDFVIDRSKFAFVE